MSHYTEETILRTNGYLWIKEDGEWEIVCRQATGEFRGYVDIFEQRHIMFTDGQDCFACLPQNVEVVS